MKRLKHYLASCLLSLALILPTTAMADFLSDVNALFDWAEVTFPDLFEPPTGETLTWDVYTYRYYPTSGTYAGVAENGDVYVLGGAFGDDLVFIDTLDNLLANFPILGSGGCATVPFPANGSRVVWSVSGSSDGQSVSGSIDTTYVTVNNTMALTSTQSRLTAGGTTTVSDTDTEQTYHISDDFLYMESIDISGSASIAGFSVPISSAVTFNPAQLETQVNEFCQGDSWTSTASTMTITANGMTTTAQSPSSTGKVEAVGENVTTPAGTFSTVRVSTTESDGSKTVAWTAINNGLLILNKFYNAGGVLETTNEATLVQ